MKTVCYSTRENQFNSPITIPRKHPWLSLNGGPTIYEPRHEKTGLLHMRKTKMQISFAVTVKLIRAFVFVTQIVQSLYFLNTKFQVSSHFLWLHSPVCVEPGRNPRRFVFSQQGSYLKQLRSADDLFYWVSVDTIKY